MAKLLIIEDDEVISRELRTRLSRENHTVDISDNGDDGVYRLQHFDYDLAVVDWNLPGMEGVDICSRIRMIKPDLPLLMLTSRSALADKIAGLDAGAMDYLVKPCNLTELSARIRALLRRTSETDSRWTVFSDLQLNANSREAKCNGVDLKLSPTEFDMLLALVGSRDTPLDFKAISKIIDKEYNAAAHNTLKQYVLNLRRKLDQSGSKTTIEFERNAGYRIADKS